MRRLIPLLFFLAIACAKQETPAPAFTGDANRGRELIAQYGCNVCHVIPGIAGMQGMLAPDLTGVTTRATISNGVVPNTPENLVQYIQVPASLNRFSAMPAVGVTPEQARDIAAYLHTLR
jgi:cytochrome c